MDGVILLVDAETAGSGAVGMGVGKLRSIIGLEWSRVEVVRF